MQTIPLPPLAEGEIYVGCIGDAAGNLHHIILLPGDNDDAMHETQLEWAKSIGQVSERLISRIEDLLAGKELPSYVPVELMLVQAE